MRFMVLVKANKDPEAPQQDDEVQRRGGAAGTVQGGRSPNRTQKTRVWQRRGIEFSRGGGSLTS